MATANTSSRAADAELVTKLLAGDESAFISIVDGYHSSLLRLANSFVPSQAVAEEVVQETWEGVLKGLPNFQGRSSLKTWIFRILTNRAKTRGSREGRSVPFSALEAKGDSGNAAVDPERFTAKGAWSAPPGRWHENLPDEKLQGKQTLGLIEEAIGKLPANQRVVVTMRDVEELTSAEVCNILDISETNQRVLLHRARSRLRNVLEHKLQEE